MFVNVKEKHKYHQQKKKKNEDAVTMSGGPRNLHHYPSIYINKFQ